MSDENVIDFEKVPQFKFAIGEEEFLRIEKEGPIFVRGKQVADDIELYEGFKVWLQCSTAWQRAREERLAVLEKKEQKRQDQLLADITDEKSLKASP